MLNRVTQFAAAILMLLVGFCGLAGTASAQIYTLDAATLAQQTPVVMSGKTLVACIRVERYRKPCYSSFIFENGSLSPISKAKPLTEEWKAQIEEYIQETPKGPHFYFVRADAYARAHDYLTALAGVNDVLRRSPSNPDAWKLRSELYSIAGRDDLALKDLEAVEYWAGRVKWWAMGTTPKDVLVSRSRIYIRQGKPELAEVLVENHLKSLRPGVTPSDQVLAVKREVAAVRVGLSATEIADIDGFLLSAKIDDCRRFPQIDTAAKANYRPIAVANAKMLVAAVCENYDEALKLSEVVLADYLSRYDPKPKDETWLPIFQLRIERARFYDKSGQYNKAVEEWARLDSFVIPIDGTTRSYFDERVAIFQKALAAKQPIEPAVQTAFLVELQARVTARDAENTRLAGIGQFQICSTGPEKFQVNMIYVNTDGRTITTGWRDRYERGGCTAVIEAQPYSEVLFAISSSDFKNESLTKVRCMRAPSNGNAGTGYKGGCDEGEYNFLVMAFNVERGTVLQKVLQFSN